MCEFRIDWYITSGKIRLLYRFEVTISGLNIIQSYCRSLRGFGVDSKVNVCDKIKASLQNVFPIP